MSDIDLKMAVMKDLVFFFLFVLISLKFKGDIYIFDVAER